MSKAQLEYQARTLQQILYYIYSVAMAQTPNFLVSTYTFTKQQVLNLTNFLATVTSPLIDKITPQLAPYYHSIEPYIKKGKDFYEEHRLVILLAGAVTITYLLVRPGKAEEAKQKRKKSGIAKRQIASKSFISDNSQIQNQPSTGTRREVESSGREAIHKKKADNKFLQRIQSSSQQQEMGDKIFFEVYKTYQVSRR